MIFFVITNLSVEVNMFNNTTSSTEFRKALWEKQRKEQRATVLNRCRNRNINTVVPVVQSNTVLRCTRHKRFKRPVYPRPPKRVQQAQPLAQPWEELWAQQRNPWLAKCTQQQQAQPQPQPQQKQKQQQLPQPQPQQKQLPQPSKWALMAQQQLEQQQKAKHQRLTRAQLAQLAQQRKIDEQTWLKQNQPKCWSMHVDTPPYVKQEAFGNGSILWCNIDNGTLVKFQNDLPVIAVVADLSNLVLHGNTFCPISRMQKMLDEIISMLLKKYESGRYLIRVSLVGSITPEFQDNTHIEWAFTYICAQLGEIVGLYAIISAYIEVRGGICYKECGVDAAAMLSILPHKNEHKAISDTTIERFRLRQIECLIVATGDLNPAPKTDNRPNDYGINYLYTFYGCIKKFLEDKCQVCLLYREGKHVNQDHLKDLIQIGKEFRTSFTCQPI
jgi:hypothetical protein